MLRRSVLQRAGTFLPLRKAADSEYAERLATLVGPVVDTGSPLAITRLRSGSLSRGDFSYQWSDPDRILFRGTYRAWHRRLAALETRSLALALDELPVPVAASFTRGLAVDSARPPHLQRCYLGDLSADPTEPSAALHDRYLELTCPPGSMGRAASDPGDPSRPGPVPVGLWHVEAPEASSTRRPEMHPAWFDAVAATPGLRPVTRLEPVLVERLVVLDARSLLLLPSQPCTVVTDSVQVQVRPDDVQPGPAGLPVDLLGVSDVCARLWGHRPAWLLPDAPADRVVVRAALPGLTWHDEGRALQTPSCGDQRPGCAPAAAQSAAATTSGTSS